MWIKQAYFVQMVAERAEAVGKSHALELQNAAHQSTIDWMRAQLNQVQRERAQLLSAATGTRFTAPEIMRETPEDRLQQLPTTFEDVGDEMAELLKLYHLPDGTLTDIKPATPKDN